MYFSPLFELPRAAFSIASCLVAMLILSSSRLWLYWERRSDVAELTAQQRLKLFWLGVRLDGVIVSRSGLLMVLAALFLPEPLFAGIQPLLFGYLGIFYFILFFVEIAGLYFFRFYDFRPNYLVFEHGADREVLKTVIKAYPVVRIFFLSVAGTCLAVIIVQMLLAIVKPGQFSEMLWLWDRGATFLWLLLTAFAARGTLDHRPLNPSLATFSTNRIGNEIASCGLFNLLYELSHRSKDEFTALKSVIALPSADQAVSRARRVLASEGPFADDGPNPLVRRVSNGATQHPLNVVLVVMESFTGRLTGCLGGAPALSPELDRLAAEGLLFERCYATGERTIQGLEAAVCSFPPLPGAGVVKRPQARQNFATLASVLKGRGYATRFLYGGQGIFDHMLGFFVGNGFDQFIEEKDFANPAYKSPWGVSDEDLFQRADQEFRRLHGEGKPFFATILTVSLHSPWQYPTGRITPLSADTNVPPGFKLAELNNFLYADYCIGKFIRDARESAYFDDTLFVFVGDHGVHLRGSDLIPVDEYRVPALFFAPAHIKARRIGEVTSQIDLPPTIMGIVGGDYRSPFLGRDVLNGRQKDPFAIVIYNKKRYGIVAEKELVVLSENGDKLAYGRIGQDQPWARISMTPGQTARSEDAVALLRVAEDLLVSGRYSSNKNSV